jgi:hypothetical protein
MKQTDKDGKAVTATGKAQWKDTPASTADQIEVSLRRGNKEKLAGLNAIIAQCMAVRDMSDNAPMREFAGVIEGIARSVSV